MSKRSRRRKKQKRPPRNRDRTPQQPAAKRRSTARFRLKPLRPPTFPRWARIAMPVVIVALSVAIFAAGKKVAVERSVEFALTAGEGKTTIALASDLEAISPGCGCIHPVFSERPWYGMSIPSRGFELNVGAAEGAAERWTLTVTTPDVELVDWTADSFHTQRITVSAVFDDRRKTVFEGRAAHLVMKSRSGITVSQKQKYPYAVVIPASGGVTTFGSRGGVREDCCAVLNVSSQTPPREEMVVETETVDQTAGDAEIEIPLNEPASSDEGSPETASQEQAQDVEELSSEDLSDLLEATQRGPLIDVLGPSVQFSTFHEPGNFVYVGRRRVRGLEGADEVHINVRTPYSVRLAAHPTTLEWETDLASSNDDRAADLSAQRSADGPASHADAPAIAPEFQSRNSHLNALPEYSVEMSDILVPSAKTWRRFYRESALDKPIKPFLFPSERLDLDMDFYTAYGLPPILEYPEVGVFGRVTRLESSALAGQVITGGKVVNVARGEQLTVKSSRGIQAGHLRYTPLVFSGRVDAETRVAGTASARLDGAPLTRAGWLDGLAGAIAAIGVGVAGSFAFALLRGRT